MRKAICRLCVGLLMLVGALTVIAPAASADPDVSTPASVDGCGPSGCGSLHISYVYRTGRVSEWEYTSWTEWVTDMRNGTARGVKGDSGYTSIWVEDTRSQAEASAHFDCPYYGGQCNISTTNVRNGSGDGPYAGLYLTANYVDCKTTKQFVTSESRGLAYWLYYVAEAYTDHLDDAIISNQIPGSLDVIEKAPHVQCYG